MKRTWRYHYARQCLRYLSSLLCWLKAQHALPLRYFQFLIYVVFVCCANVVGTSYIPVKVICFMVLTFLIYRYFVNVSWGYTQLLSILCISQGYTCCSMLVSQLIYQCIRASTYVNAYVYLVPYLMCHVAQYGKHYLMHMSGKPHFSEISSSNNTLCKFVEHEITSLVASSTLPRNLCLTYHACSHRK